MDKYYTPKIEEFYFGFEFESKETFMDGTVKTKKDFNEHKWGKEICDIGSLPYIERALIGTNAKNKICGIRVKYLDRGDIENTSNVFNTVGNKTYLTNETDAPYVIELKNKTVTIKTIIGKEQLFKGTIKNKSKLKSILNDLEI